MTTEGITTESIRELMKSLPKRIEWGSRRPIDNDPLVYAMFSIDNPTETRYIIEGYVEADEPDEVDLGLWATFTAWDDLLRSWVTGITLDKLYQHGWMRVVGVELPQPLSKVCKTYRPPRKRKQSAKSG